jgi:paraquat-inducible protein A
LPAGKRADTERLPANDCRRRRWAHGCGGARLALAPKLATLGATWPLRRHFFVQSNALIICRQCDSVHRRVPLADTEVARCHRCGATLYHNNRYDLNAMLALTLASLCVFAIANWFPLMSLEVGGRHSHTTVWQMIATTYQSNVTPIAFVAAATVFFFPLLQICLFAYVLVALLRGRVPPGFAAAMHTLRQMQPWTMVEVFLIGTLVAVVKLSDIATATPDLGMWGFAALTGLLTALNSFDLRELWDIAAGLES